ncbi:transcriptional regulatory protein PHO23 [Rhizoctonia solani]|uniref:Transcriptional regulatory protein PHO23 n=1 Tax=Rhizoctonia solani TaxID=456999 RepID=A0A8H8PAD7_9AGAM|nr:transcriptional regulatory protein PHO23 [Rhizoctonia solani]QRW27708.1 transcriptional regulatory protein PHO23 [Rhizoctonia solani]
MMKRKRDAPKPLTGLESAAMDIVVEQDGSSTPTEDPAAAEWTAFAQDYYELVEQLPLSIHRSYSLMRELDDLAQDNTARILPATRAYIALRDSLGAKPRGHRRAPSGLDLLAHVSAVVEPPTVSTPPPNLTNGAGVTHGPITNGQVNGHVESDRRTEVENGASVPTSAVDPTPTSPALGSTNPLPTDTRHIIDSKLPANTEQPGSSSVCNNPSSDNFPHDTRKLLTLIATLASDAVRASSEKLGIANAVYHSVRFRRQPPHCPQRPHYSAQVHAPPSPTPTPPVESPAPIQLVSSPSIKLRPRRLSTQAKHQEEGDGPEDDQQGTIPPLKITRTPTTIRIRNKSKGKDESRQRGVSISGSTSNHNSNAKTAGSNKTPKVPPPTPRKSTGAGAVNGKPPGNKNNSKKTATDEIYCFCGEGSFGEMIACDADGCEREWASLKVVPEENEEWFCADCKKAGTTTVPVAKKRRRR